MKKSIDETIQEAILFWDLKSHCSFLENIFHLIDLYDVDENDDWIKDAVGELDVRNVRLIRTVYVISKIAENHAGRLLAFKARFPNLCEKLEKYCSGLEIK